MVGNNVNLCPAKSLIDCRYPKVLFQVLFRAQHSDGKTSGVLKRCW